MCGCVETRTPAPRPANLTVTAVDGSPAGPCVGCPAVYERVARSLARQPVEVLPGDPGPVIAYLEAAAARLRAANA